MLERKVKWAAALGLIASLVLLAPVFVATAREAWQREIKIGWTPPDVTGVFKTATDYFILAVEDANRNGFNVRLITRAPPSHTAFADQVAIIEDFIEMGVDVLAISPIEVEVVRPVVREANRRGIPVIMVNLLEEIEGVAVASYIGFDNTIAAAVTAYAVADYFGGPGVLGTGRKVDVTPATFIDLAFYEALYATLTPAEIAAIQARGTVIEGVAGGFFSEARKRGFFGVIDKFPGIEILGVPCPTGWRRVDAIACTEAWIATYPTGLDFIWAASNELGLGAMLALEAVGRRESALEGPVLGNATAAVFNQGTTPESATRVREGRIVSDTTHGFPDWGWFGVYLAVRSALGLAVPEFYDIRPRIAYTGNVDLFFPPTLPALNWAGIIREVRERP
jgi:ribose transport system substrate-binding protein